MGNEKFRRFHHHQKEPFHFDHLICNQITVSCKFFIFQKLYTSLCICDIALYRIKEEKNKINSLSDCKVYVIVFTLTSINLIRIVHPLIHEGKSKRYENRTEEAVVNSKIWSFFFRVSLFRWSHSTELRYNFLYGELLADQPPSYLNLSMLILSIFNINATNKKFTTITTDTNDVLY